MKQKNWLDPVQLAANHGFNVRELNHIERLVNENAELLLGAWHENFS